jgi:uncharacterized membrane protein
MARIEKSIEIKAPPEKVWPYVFWDRVPEYLDTIKKAEYTSKEKLGVGATAHIWSSVAGSKDEWEAETTEWIENRKHAWRTISGNLTAIGSMTYTPIKGGTKATFVMDYDLPYSVLGKLIDKLRVSKEMDKGMEQAMKKLKERAEK